MNIKFAAENLMNYYDFVVSEAIVYDESIATAGTADLVMRDKQTGEYVLMDFKTKPGKLNGKQINKKINHCVVLIMLIAENILQNHIMMNITFS
mgnify:CR=1 FL=1